jgi:hypothetical protein
MLFLTVMIIQSERNLVPNTKLCSESDFFSESSLHELEQVDVRKSIPAEINSVDPAGPSGQTLSTNIAALKVDFFSKMVNMVVDERLQQRAKWKGDLKKKEPLLSRGRT